jgi:putative heme-binding domain-containing protein
MIQPGYRLLRTRFVTAAWVLLCWTSAYPDVVTNYTLVDSELKAVTIDTDPKESFLSLQLDSAGRLFAGGREALFVYETDPTGLYQSRQLLYRFPANSWISDIAIRGHDLYIATHTAIYLVEGAVIRRAGLHPKRLLWGMPPLAYFEEHQGFHGLIFGPDGDLYVSFGDNLVGYGDFKRPDHWGHWTFFHSGASTPYTGAGGVLRLSPDGRQLSVIARGLRNPCGLVFDADWNLFSNDNDHESIPQEYVPGRLLHVMPLADFSWPRGWLLEKHPWRADLLDSLNPNLGRYVPTSQAYYNEKYLPEKFRHNLLIAEWAKGVVPRYPLRSSGASFKADQIELLLGRNNARPVGIAVGRGGRIFVCALHMAGNEVSPIAKSDIIMITRADDSATAPFEPYDETKVDEKKLLAELTNSSWQPRYRAHIELMRRVRDTGKPDFRDISVRNELIWLVAAGGQTARIAELAGASSDNTRLQVIRALTRFGRSLSDYDVFVKALTDKNPQIVHAGLVGLYVRFDKFPFDPIRTLASSEDTYLRQIACQLLAAKASLNQLESLADSIDVKHRLAGVLTLGIRLTVPPAIEPLSADCPLDASTFNPMAQYADQMEDLRQFGRIGAFTFATFWAKKTKTEGDQRIFDLLMRRLNDADERVAKQAAFYLRLLADSRTDVAAAQLLKIENAAIVQPIQGATAATAVELQPEYRDKNWANEAAAGNAEQGRVLFDKLGCLKCHAINPTDAGSGAPSLVGAGARFSAAYLAESVLVPNKMVSPAFRWTGLALSDEEEAAGLVVGETDDRVELLLINGTRRTFEKKKITSRRIQEISPMPEGLIKNPAELRDLLAFLISKKEAPVPK